MNYRYRLVSKNIMNEIIQVIEFSNLTTDRWQLNIIAPLRYAKREFKRALHVSELTVTQLLYVDGVLSVMCGLNSQNHIFVEDIRND